jgi:hypothetical protein
LCGFYDLSLSQNILQCFCWRHERVKYLFEEEFLHKKWSEKKADLWHPRRRNWFIKHRFNLKQGCDLKEGGKLVNVRRRIEHEKRFSIKANQSESSENYGAALMSCIKHASILRVHVFDQCLCV